VLLLTDLNSGIAVLGQSTRRPGILMGQGPERNLRVQYVPENAPLQEGEVLVTSGAAGIFPKGLPIGRVVRVAKSQNTLFQDVDAVPLADLKDLEEILVLRRHSPPAAPDISDLDDEADEPAASPRPAARAVAKPEPKPEAGKPEARPEAKPEARRDGTAPKAKRP
jgi:rod shape-determining protein MreC